MFFLIYYKYIDIIFGLCSWLLLEPVIDQQLVIWDPFETSSEPIHLSGFLFIFQEVPASGCFLFFGFESKGISLIFCVFWKRFWKCGGTLELLLILTIRSALNAPMFQRPASKSRYVFCFCFFYDIYIIRIFWYPFGFFRYICIHTHIYIYIYMAWIKEGGNK